MTDTAAPTVPAPLPIIDPPPPPRSATRPDDNRPPAADPAAPPTDSPNAPPQAAANSAPGGDAQPKAAADRGDVTSLIPFVPTNATEAWRLAAMYANSASVPTAIRGDRASVFALITLGMQFNIPPILALSSIHIIKGKPCMSAAMIVAIIKGSRLCRRFVCIESTAKRSVWESVRLEADGTLGEPVRLDFTIEEADQMGLLSKGRTAESAERNQWHLQPKTMLRWRAATALARMEWPDLLLGMYSTEEMFDALDIDGPEVRTVGVTKSDLDAAKPGIRDLVSAPALPAPAAPDEFDRAMGAADASRSAPQPQPQPAKRGLAQRIGERRQQTLGACEVCGGPVAAGVKICDPCERT